MKTRLVALLLCLFSSSFTLVIAADSSHVTLKRRDVTKTFLKKDVLTMYVNQIVEIEVKYRLYSDISDTSYGKAAQRNIHPWPDFAEGLKFDPEGWDTYIKLSPGQDTTLTQTLILNRPQETGEHTIEITSVLKKDPAGKITTFYMATLKIIVIDPNVDPPSVFDEPTFTPGLSNTVFWQPIDDANTQDIYCYDILDSTNLIYARRRLYKSLFQDSVDAVFQGLEDGHTYAYFAKSTHLWNNDTISLFSETVYSTQDNSPPETVISPNIVVQNDRKLRLVWNATTDLTSNVEGYIIYRKQDSDYEICLDTIPVTDPATQSYQWLDANLDSGKTYVYRITAFDEVGNESDGNYSISITPSETIGNPDGNPDPLTEYEHPLPISGKTYIQTCIDTLDFWPYIQDNQVKAIRLISVRDDTNYFHQKPAAGARYFDSGWIDPYLLSNYMFDYHYSGSTEVMNDELIYLENGQFIDKNFVDGHEYFRKMIVDFNPGEKTYDIGSVIPDCFAPDDVQHLNIQTVIDNPDPDDTESGFTSWHVQLSWTPASDGASQVKRYHVYRQIMDGHSEIEELAISADKYLRTSFVDSSFIISGNQNSEIVYHVIAEDHTGNMMTVEESQREVKTRALNAPVYEFVVDDAGKYMLWDVDTLITNQDVFRIQFTQFNTGDISKYIVRMDSTEIIVQSTQQSELELSLSDIEFTDFKIRAIYKSGESTIWSLSKTVYQVQDVAPENFRYINKPDDWSGNNTFQWEKPSFDVKYYEIWRRTSSTDSSLVDIFSTRSKYITWIDEYSRDEINEKSGDTLVAHHQYTYRVRKVDVFNQPSLFTSPRVLYCSKPPEIYRHDMPTIEYGQYIFTIYWNRPEPNYYRNNFITKIEVYEDSLTHKVLEDTVSEETSYTYYHAQLDHNYIFRIQEIPNQNPSSLSNWSRPYTVSSLVKLEPFALIPQPKGKMYLNWQSDSLFEKYRVEKFIFCRDTTCIDLPLSTISCMDSSVLLIHDRIYNYSIYGIDSLEQVVLANTASDTVDTGSVFIPEVLNFEKRYFNSDSIQVFWEWKNRLGKSSQNPRHAVECILDVSVNPNFPEDTLQTVRVGPFRLEDHPLSIFAPVPVMLGRVNDELYFRIKGLDPFGNPQSGIWSSDFFTMKTVAMDTILPYPVTDLGVIAVDAYNLTPDTVIHTLTWTGKDVEYLFTQSNLHWDRFTGNIHRYRLYRENGTNDFKVGEWIATGDSLFEYSLCDTVLNIYHDWYLIVEDSAGNAIKTTPITQGILVQTPEPPNPVDYRSCVWDAFTSDSIQYEYYVQMAMSHDHFELAYLVGSESTKSRLLCESDWTSETSFECPNGWGYGVIDTTWFRIQTRGWWHDQYWESAWSEISFFTGGEYPLDEDVVVEDIPVTFKVYPVYPNPFNSQATLRYDLADPGEVDIRIYNVLGQEVYHYHQIENEAGHFVNIWPGTDRFGQAVSSGVYIALVSQKTDKGVQHVERMRLLLIK